MNTTMVDVTDYPDVKAGDEVVIFGKQGNAEITQSEIEDITGTLFTEIYANWGNSNPKFVKAQITKSLKKQRRLDKKAPSNWRCFFCISLW